MEFSVSRNNYCDTEDSFSEDSLNPTLSEGYIPCEDTVSCEDTTLQEEITFNVDVSVQLLLTREGRGGMESENSPLNRQDQIQDSSEMVFMQSSALPWHDHDDILVNEDYILQSLLNNLHGYLQSLSDNEENQTDDNENQTDENEDKRDDNENEKSEQIQENDKVEESVFPETSEGHGFQLGSSSSPHMAQMSHGESDTCQDSPRCKSSENKDVAQFPEMTPMLKGQNLTKVSTEMPLRRARERPNEGARLQEQSLNIFCKVGLDTGCLA
ncbi:uncharacterized protein C12orf71 homolog [Heterocephalus glaber]|uniref:Uncharacterized protein C12orf71 homolog n=1 Tax=Heterocephalus glaber TaxID=10181 RepID=A0AAX6QBQ0_HETGA|nr:uncharacterized protein C12orf71 homolog [Heterocephalus glaber]